MLPGVRRGRDSSAMASDGKGSKIAPRKAEHEYGWERIARYCVPASVTAIGGPRARHAVLPRGTPNSDDIFSYRFPAPPELEKKTTLRFTVIATTILCSTIG